MLLAAEEGSSAEKISQTDCTSGESWIVEPSNAVEDREACYAPASQQARGHAENERWVVLEAAVNDPDDLEDAEASECYQRNSFITLLAPDSNNLRDEKQGVAEQT